MTAAAFGRQFVWVGQVALVVAAVLFFAPRTVSAQPAATAQASNAPTEDPSWSLIGGFEADTHGTGYTFFGPSYVRPVRSNLAVTARVFGNYLYYEFEDGIGLAKVSSPGVTTGAGLRFGSTSYVGIQAGPSFKQRRKTLERASGRSEASEGVVGVGVGAEVYANPTEHNNIHAIVDYGSADRYLWSRVGFKEQLSNPTWSGSMTHFGGGEVIVQGNDDIRSVMLGGLFEFVHVPSTVSLVLRGGYKKSTFALGPDKTGPYFGVGFYKRLN